MESSMSLFSNQSVAKKHTWKGDVVSQEDRFSPSRDSLDSGFSSFPASPNSSSSNTADAPPQLVKVYNNSELKEDAPPQLINCSLFNNANEVLTEDEDEPACKMPRLVPIDEESDNELIEESTILPPLSVPENEEEEPKPETATIPTIPEESTKVKSSGRRVRIATPNEEVDENEDPYAKCYKPQHPCQWADCSEAFFDVNDLYDHAMEQHLQLLRPSDSISNSSGRRELSTQDDKEDDEQKYRCQWLDCDMSLRRGTEEKKFDWLMNHHFRARHAPKAQPLKCLIKGCPIRFQNAKTLTAHLLNSHDDRPVRKTQQPVVKQISCYDYLLPVRTETYGVYDFFDNYTFDLIGKKVEKYYTESNEQTDDVNNIEVEEKPAQQIIPSMPRKKTVTVLRKIFARRLTHLRC